MMCELWPRLGVEWDQTMHGRMGANRSYERRLLDKELAVPCSLSTEHTHTFLELKPL